MSDLIDRQAAINALGERPMVWTDSDYEIAQRNQYDMDKLAIETAPSAQPKQQWIPCSERLPKEYGNYLITTHNGDVDVGTIDPKKKGVWSACDADGFYWIREVVAWMPLPEPAKLGGD